MILSVICIYSKKYSETESVQNKIYIMILKSTVLLLIFDIFSRLDGHTNTLLPVLNQAGNFFIFFTTPVISSLWVLYVYHYIYRTEEQKKWVVITILTINAVNCIMVILSQRYAWFYYIDTNNIYHRGPLYAVAVSFTFLQLIIAATLIIKNQNRIERKHYFAMLFFVAPPVFCIIMQILFLGFSFVYNGVALSSLIVFLYVQNQDVFTDYLTGVANRKKLELHLRKMISSSTINHTFSAIMIDLDNFKKINDSLGHKVGDEALKAAAELMKSCLGKQDFIARYGGDEFCVVLDTSDISLLKDIVIRIRRSIDEYNAASIRPYKLGLSMGYAIYDYGMNVDEFQNMIDKLMYEHKHSDEVISNIQCLH